MKETYYIVRCDRAGVFAEHIKAREGQEVTMTDVRRLWYWSGAAFARDHGLSPDSGEMTVGAFIDLTRDAFGGETIRALERVWKREKRGINHG